jgi:tetratricopeptide (TPR) repeat protein
LYKDTTKIDFLKALEAMIRNFHKWLILSFIWLIFFPVASQTPSNDSIPEYEKLYSQGVSLVDSGEYEAAIPFFKKAVKKNSSYWEAYMKMAYAKIKLGDHKGAKKDLEKAEKIVPFNYDIYKLKGINDYLSGNFSESKAAIDTAVYIAVEEKKEDAELFYYRALLMFKGKSYKTALDACETALEFNPKYIEIFILKGEIRFTMKEYNHAIKELNEAIALMRIEKPDYKAYKLRAKSKFEVADYKGAIRDWDVYIDGNPKEEEALISRGAAKINVNDNTGAIADLDEAIKINSKNPVSYCYRGVAKGGNKAYIEGLKDLDYAIKLKFDYPAAYVNRAAIKMASKDKRGACDDLAKADGLGDEMALKLIERYCKQR